MEKKELLYEGKAKKVFTTEDPDALIVSYKDDATAFDGQKKGTIVGKGAINNRMTNHVFKLLEAEGVPTHLIEELNDRETVVKKVEIVPLEVIIRNFSAGSFAKKMGMEEGIELKCPTLEFSYKNDDLHDPFINSYYALALDLATQEEIDVISKYAFQVNEVMRRYFAGLGIELIDLRSSLAAITARSSWRMRYRRTPAGCGTRRLMKSLTRTGSEGTLAMWKTLTTRCSNGWGSSRGNSLDGHKNSMRRIA